VDQTGASVVGRAVLALALSSSLLACPPTTVPAKDDDHRYYFFASPYGPHVDEEALARPSELPPEFPWLPLWDLAVTRAELMGLEDRAWLTWTLDTAQSKPESGHAWLVNALSSSTLTAGRMLWWLAHAPATGDAHDALIDAYDRSDDVRIQHLLANALVLVHWEASCPVEIGPDGACRMPGASIAIEHDLLLRRDGIAVERAKDWQRKATKLAKRVKIDPSDLAMQALLAEVRLASMLDGYESVLVARMPEDLDFVIEEYLADSENPEWQRTYARQVARADESTKRFGTFIGTDIGCINEQFADFDLLRHASPDVALLALLRQSKLLLAFVETVDENARQERDAARKWIEHREPKWHHGHASPHDPVAAQALTAARRCVEIGTMIGGDAKILEACFDVLEVHDHYRHVPLAELVPEPGARTTTMHAFGVIGPDQDPSAQQRNPVE
jgi:hypothetical protein